MNQAHRQREIKHVIRGKAITKSKDTAGGRMENENEGRVRMEED